MASDNFNKCSDAPPNACGSNAMCFDDPNDAEYYKYEGPYCKCNKKFIGTPPKCEEGCRKDYGCDDDEFCGNSQKCEKGCRRNGCPENQICDLDTRKCVEGCLTENTCDDDEYCSSDKKCQKICDNFSCGLNSKCSAENHKKICSCMENFIANRGTGCIGLNESKIKEFNCEESCAPESICIKERKACFCNDKKDNDPFTYCKQVPPFFPAPFPPFRPGSEDSISLQCAAALCLG